MKQISIIFSKNEVLSTTIFEYCQNIIKLLLLMFQYTVVKMLITIRQPMDLGQKF